jgi:predicted metal-dependent peptidase
MNNTLGLNMLAIGKQLTAEQRLHKATTDIIGDMEFIALAGVLMIGKKQVVDGLPTAATNGRDEFYGREFVDSLNDPELRYLMLHECYHKMYQHLTTWKGLHDINHGLANAACDYVINIKLDDSDAGKRKWITMPKQGLVDEQYRGMDAKQVFDKLIADGKQDQFSQGEGTGIDSHDWDGAQQLSKEEADALKKDIDDAIRQGAIMAGKAGSGGLRDMVELLEPKKDWRELLREFISTSCSGKDYSTWRKPNRRYVGINMLMPSSISESMGEIIVAIDTSGSIGSEELAHFLGEVKGICDTVKPSVVRVLYWDTAVCADEEYAQDQLDSLVRSTKPAGGGGTMVECVPQYMAEKQLKPECVVVLTDGYLGGSWGEWTTPLIWCIRGNKSATASCGVTVHIED